MATAAHSLDKTVPIALRFDGGEVKRVQLKNLMAGATLSLRAKADCELRIELSHAASASSVFAVNMPTLWDAALRIADSGDYIFTIRNSAEKNCSLSGDFTTSLDLSSVIKGSAGLPDLEKVSREIQKVFLAEDIKYLLIECQTANSFAEASTVILCREHMEKLQAFAASDTIAQQLILYTLMHETSHVLLTQWQYPFSSNEDVVDEFAVVLLLLMQRKTAVLEQATYFEAQPALPEYRHKLEKNDRHTLSVQRARNLRTWANDKGLLLRWMTFLIPHMQSEALQTLRKKTSVPDLAEKIDAELARRET